MSFAGANAIAAASSRRTMPKASVPGSPESSFFTCSNRWRPSSLGSISTTKASRGRREGQGSEGDRLAAEIVAAGLSRDRQNRNVMAARQRGKLLKQSLGFACGGSPAAGRHRHGIDGDQPQVLDPLDQSGEPGEVFLKIEGPRLAPVLDLAQRMKLGQIPAGGRNRNPNTSGSPCGAISSTAPFGAIPSWHGQALPVVTRAITSVTKADLPLPGAPPRTVSLPRAMRSGQTHSGVA